MAKIFSLINETKIYKDDIQSIFGIYWEKVVAASAMACLSKFLFGSGDMRLRQSTVGENSEYRRYGR